MAYILHDEIGNNFFLKSMKNGNYYYMYFCIIVRGRESKRVRGKYAGRLKAKKDGPRTDILSEND